MKIEFIIAIAFMIIVANTFGGVQLKSSNALKTNDEWTVFTSNQCQVSIMVPPNSEIKEKSNRFEQGVDLKITSFVNSTGIMYGMVCSPEQNEFNNGNLVGEHAELYKSFLPTKWGDNIKLIEDTNITKWKIGGHNASSVLISTYTNERVPIVAVESIITTNDKKLITMDFVAQALFFDSDNVQTVEKKMIESIKFIK